MTEKASTRERIIDAAMELFHAKGYNATGLAEILEKAGANSGSLYYFFKTKEDLLLAVLEKYKTLLWPIVISPVFERTADPLERIFGVLAGYRQALVMTECSFGCPIGNLALEIANYSPTARQKIGENFLGWCAAIRQCLEDLRGRLPDEFDCNRLANFILTVMEGGVMQARTFRSLEPFDACVDLLRDYLSRLLAARPTNSASPGVPVP